MKSFALGIVVLLSLLLDVIEAIIGGRQVPVQDYTFQISISIIQNLIPKPEDRQIQSEATKISIHKCGGVILNDEWVLTAAHCMVNPQTRQLYFSPEDIGVGVGSNDLVEFYDNGPIPAAEIIITPDYDPSTMLDDVCLIRLSIPISQSVFKNHRNYTEACLGSLESSSQDVSLQALGWGNTVLYKQQGDDPTKFGPVQLSRYLKTLAVNDTSTTDKNCDNRPDLICLKAVQPGTSTCRGDSGSALLAHDGKTVVGLSSASDPEMFEGKLAYCLGTSKYARLSTALPWIEKTIGQPVCKTNI